MLKKGVEALLDPIKEIILALVIFGALVTIVLMLILPSGIIASEWSCKTSVAWASGTSALFKKLGYDSITCFTEDVKSDAEEKKEALNDIAEYMRKCWNMWGEGNLNPEGKNMFYGAQEKCFTCYRINFPELEETVSISDIDIYLKDDTRDYNKIGGKTSYWNYFKRSNPSNYVNVVLPAENENSNVISKDKNYAVVYFEGVETSKLGNILTWGLIGGTIGYFGTAAICAIPVVGTASCVAIGALTVGGAKVGYDWGWSKLKGPAVDGIQFMDYDVAKNNCVTVVRAGMKFGGGDKEKSGGAGVEGGF